MYYVYVLYCRDEKLYIGYTTDLKKRIQRHKNGESFATKGRLPVQLIFYEAFLDRMDAKQRQLRCPSVSTIGPVKTPFL